MWYTLNYAAPRVATPPPTSTPKADHELLCLVKLIQYFLAATLIGSVLSILVATAIDWIMK
jgi:hypothetical protein